MLYDQFMKFIRWVLDSDIGYLFAFAGMIATAVKIFSMLVRKTKYANRFAQGVVLTCIALFGVILPVLILCYSPWVGFKNIILNVLAIFMLFCFGFLVYIIKSMNRVLASEEAVLRIRSKHTFFGGGLNIYMLEEFFEGRPLAHRITAKVWAGDEQEVLIKKQTVGHSIKYRGKENYLVRIIDACDCQATFRVTKQ